MIELTVYCDNANLDCEFGNKLKVNLGAVGIDSDNKVSSVSVCLVKRYFSTRTAQRKRQCFSVILHTSLLRAM